MLKMNVFVVALLFFLTLPSDALAYLDPGAGSAILQGILGALAAICVTFKLYWPRLLRLFGFKKNVAEEPGKIAEAATKDTDD